ncbi:hypothetical protein [Roseibacillus ishigakijimensis]|uniref:Uncharacterized protein n=1 Tax=Roseibacillus ishigakijimensis TaxID=454146 RepID=A0A934VNI9_9BACT|nr:hypothetical protein [Roseibacillus ishigakijimensis]MBK1835352.1 hypothetical protein [Roseibacillus ishigakijimensis]
MKKFIAGLMAVSSGLYLATMGIWPEGVWPDVIPIIDEGIAFIILVNSLAALGVDLRRFVGMKGDQKRGGGKREDGPIDIN